MSMKRVHSRAVWAEVEVGGVRLGNRLMVGPMATAFSESTDSLTEKHFAFYERIAGAGLGMNSIGALAVSRTGKGFPNQPVLSVDGAEGGLRSLSLRTQDRCPTLVQLFHAGPKTSSSVTGAAVVACEQMNARKTRYDAARKLETRAVFGLVDEFALAAMRVAEAGFAGVLLHAANGYLLHTFLDQKVNDRRDLWGHPSALLVAIIREIRRTVPTGFIVSVTMPVRGIDGAVSVRSLIPVYHELARGWADALHVYRDRREETGNRISYSRLLRSYGISCPIIEGLGVLTARDAAFFLSEGATLVTMARGLLVNPTLPREKCPKLDRRRMQELGESEKIRSFFDQLDPGRWSPSRPTRASGHGSLAGYR